MFLFVCLFVTDAVDKSNNATNKQRHMKKEAATYVRIKCQKKYSSRLVVAFLGEEEIALLSSKRTMFNLFKRANNF